jgi:4-hydroxybenzoate polyprenyltransferase
VSTAALRYPRRFASLVKLEHTVFALPFAYVGAFLAWDGAPPAAELIWLTVAMVGARSLAMALNRLIDADLDARNPRTSSRELPSGRLGRSSVIGFCLASLAVFLVAVSQLAPVVRWLWPIPVVLFVAYPYLKRFTWLCHAWLGAAIGLAPVAAWVALTNELPLEAWLLGAAVATWVAGFDVLYGLFDLEVDRAQGLHSVPARFGVHIAFAVARLSHLATLAPLLAAGFTLGAGLFYWLGVAFVGALLLREHTIVSPGDLRRLDAAFFSMNGAIALGFFAFVLIDTLR